MDAPERRLLAMAVETDWGLYEALPPLRGDMPDASEAEVIARAGDAVIHLVSRGLIEMFMHSTRGPASMAEEQEVRKKMSRGFASELKGPVAVPVNVPLSPSEIERVVADPTSWFPPEGRDGRPWHETPHPYFMATVKGQRAYREELSDEERRGLW